MSEQLTREARGSDSCQRYVRDIREARSEAGRKAGSASVRKGSSHGQHADRSGWKRHDQSNDEAFENQFLIHLRSETYYLIVREC
ncbi:MAG TPA: hypothetical protein VEZ90_09145 [Blastocatellia bacterium]|nr:hypothetical protein [Blastocatellia bacterium]